jgi:predicted nucleic acid-binding protein
MGLTLPSGGLVYVDAQVFIYSVEKRPEYVDLCEELWLSVARGDTPGAVTSELTLLECLVRPLRAKDPALVERFEKFLSLPAIALIPIGLETLRRAAALWAETTRIKTADAIHLATASATQCAAIVTNDRAWVGCSSIPIILLADRLG